MPSYRSITGSCKVPFSINRIVVEMSRAQATNVLFTSRPDVEDRVITAGTNTGGRTVTSLSASLRQMTTSSCTVLFGWFLVFFTFLEGTTPSLVRADNQIVEYCENEFFSANCGDESAIIVTHALYGRMNRGKCIVDYDTGCAKDVRPYLERVCAGRSSCSVAVSSLIKDVIMPCPIDLRSYLEAAFVCTRVVPQHDDKCHVDLSKSDQKFGFFSNHVVPKSGCGSVKKPWVLMNRSGQKVNITLIDFLIETSRRNGIEDASVQPHPQCNVYVIFKELGEEGQFRTICNSTNKETNAILSSAQLLEIRLIRNVAVPGAPEQSAAGYSFMIKYEVLGCEDPDVPEGGWMRRDDFQAVIGCHGYPNERLKITCNGTAWSADPHDLCNPGKRNFLGDVLSQSSAEIFRGLSIIIIAIVAAGVGLCILLAGLTYLKKRRNMTTQQQVQQPQFYDKTSRFVQYGAYKETSYASSPQYLLTYDTPQSQTTVAIMPPINPVPPGPVMNATPSTAQNFTENLYESPKFDRKFSDDAVNSGGGGLVCFAGSESIKKAKSQENVLLG